MYQQWQQLSQNPTWCQLLSNLIFEYNVFSKVGKVGKAGKVSVSI